MNVLIDTNVILDDILNRGDAVTAARKIIRMHTSSIINGCITANCVTDIFYIVSKNLDISTSKMVIRNLLVSFRVISVDGQDCMAALNLPMDDFEDALAVICAGKSELDYIITNDKGFLSESSLNVPSIRPVDFLSKFTGR